MVDWVYFTWWKERTETLEIILNQQLNMLRGPMDLKVRGKLYFDGMTSWE